MIDLNKIEALEFTERILKKEFKEETVKAINILGKRCSEAEAKVKEQKKLIIDAEIEITELEKKLEELSNNTDNKEVKISSDSCTGFFSNIDHVTTDKIDLNIIISKSDNTMVVSTFPNVRIEDNYKKLIKPFIIRGLTKEIDEHFYSKLEEALNPIKECVTNIVEFEKQEKEAKEKSDMMKKEKEKNDKKLKSLIEKGDKLFQENKYEEALKEYTKAKELKGDVDDKIKECKEKSNQLF